MFYLQPENLYPLFLAVLAYITLYIIHSRYSKWRESKYQYSKNKKVNVCRNLTSKSPEIAVLLSLFLLGGGQIYNGRIVKGLSIIGVAGFLIILLIMLTHTPGSETEILLIAGSIVAIIIYSVVDAYSTARRINNEYAKLKESTTKKCPFCAERIKQEAVVCRYCGKDL